MTIRTEAFAIAAILALASQASATTYSLDLTGDTSGFTESMFEFNGSHYDEFSLALSGLNSSNAITVSQGDTIESTVDLNAIYTIPASQQHTDFLQYLTSSTFPNENTGVDGTFNLYDLGVEVASYGYSSTSSGILASYAALFPPQNGAIQFDSFTNDLTINDLATPATLDGSSFEYALVSPGVPEPASWALMLVGFGVTGGLVRRRAARAAV
jgi:hypothetical protein